MTRKMKDSGIEWIGEIPEDWEVVPTKYLFETNKKIVGSNEKHFDRLALTLKGVLKRDKNSIDGLQPTNFTSYQILEKDQLVFKLIDLQNISTSRVGISPYRGIVSPAYIILSHSRNKVNPKYYYYWFMNMYNYNIFNLLGDTGVRSNISSSELLKIQVPSPNSKIQNNIVRFLDKKTKQIEDIKNKISKEIENLENYKKSVITEAVTKGLDKNVEMKDSGIEWIGEIPKHWKTPAAKYHINIFNGSDPKKDGEIPVYGSGDEIFKYSEEFKIGPAVLLGRKGTIENPKFIIGKYWNVDTAFNVECKKTLNLKFYFYLAKIFDYRKYITSTALPSMTKEHYQNMRIPYPNLIEQKNIVDYLDNKMYLIDDSIAIKQKQLETLEEYKKSLIYDYVTGKKEVNDGEES
ncbi:MAG: restriction endonuclease subunit S [Finegoldia magna]|nr:restriction endonuclease subunit S [Finegoldia magna]